MEISRLENRTLLAAQGYFELGMVADATAELDSLPAARQERNEVLQIRLLILIRARRWEEALAFSEMLYVRSPEETLGFLHAAFCLHELGRTAEAKALLLKGPSKLLSEATYHYNLGCYDAALGNFKEARAHLRISFKLNRDFREAARSGPDLKSMWNAL